MQMVRGTGRGKSRRVLEVKEITINDMTLMPCAPGVCQECAVNHPAEYPHNQQSLYYQMKFNKEHGRWPTWADAMAHCSDEMKAFWVEELRKRGVEVSA